MIQSCTDFGQHGPAVAIETACLLAILVSAADLVRIRDGQEKSVMRRRNLSLLLGAAPATVLVIIMGSLWPSAISAARAEPLWRDFERSQSALMAADDPRSQAIYSSLKDHLDTLCTLEPENIDYRFWRTFVLWKITPRQTNATATQVTFSHTDVQRLISAFLKQTELCPTYGRAYWLAGRLQYRILRQPGGVDLVRLAYEISRNDPYIALELGGIDMDQKRTERALVEMRRAVGLKPKLVSSAIQICLAHEQGDALAYSLAKGNAAPLLELASSLIASHASPKIIAQCQSEAQQLLETQVANSQSLDDATTFVLLADLYRSQSRLSDAIQLYRRATDQEYSRVDWHMTLAGLLKQNGDLTAARREASICLTLRPGMSEASALLTSLNTAG